MTTASDLQAANNLLVTASKDALDAVVPALQTALDAVNAQVANIGDNESPSSLATISGYLSRCKGNISAFIEEGTYLSGQFTPPAPVPAPEETPTP